MYNEDVLGRMMGATYEVNMPSDYLHLLNCICIYDVEHTFKCYNKGTIWRCPAERLTADIYSRVLDNFWMRPTYKKPYYYIHNVNYDTKNEEWTSDVPTNPYNYETKEGTDANFKVPTPSTDPQIQKYYPYENEDDKELKSDYIRINGIINGIEIQTKFNDTTISKINQVPETVDELYLWNGLEERGQQYLLNSQPLTSLITLNLISRQSDDPLMPNPIYSPIIYKSKGGIIIKSDGNLYYLDPSNLDKVLFSENIINSYPSKVQVTIYKPVYRNEMINWDNSDNNEFEYNLNTEKYVLSGNSYGINTDRGVDYHNNLILNGDSIKMWDSIDINGEKSSNVERAAKARYGNTSKVRLEIRYGTDDSVFKLTHVYIDYIKAPQTIRLTQEQLDLTQDISQVLEFPDYVCQEIINELVNIIMERNSDPRLQTHPIVSQSIANPAQQQTEPAAQAAQ